MPTNPTGLKLRCRDGHWEWGAFELRKLPNAVGFGMVAACQYGDHWLRPMMTAPGAGLGQQVQVSCEQYAWPTASEAFAARDRYERQEKEVYR